MSIFARLVRHQDNVLASNCVTRNTCVFFCIYTPKPKTRLISRAKPSRSGNTTDSVIP